MACAINKNSWVVGNIGWEYCGAVNERDKDLDLDSIEKVVHGRFMRSGIAADWLGALLDKLDLLTSKSTLFSRANCISIDRTRSNQHIDCAAMRSRLRICGRGLRDAEISFRKLKSASVLSFKTARLEHLFTVLLERHKTYTSGYQYTTIQRHRS